MDWANFFEKTRTAAGAESFSKLAPLLHITDGAISHYRTGKRIPPAWTVAACLKLQGHAEPEKEAARIMLQVAHSGPERAFWRKLGTAAAIALCAVAIPLIASPDAGEAGTHFSAMYIMLFAAGLAAATWRVWSRAPLQDAQP